VPECKIHVMRVSARARPAESTSRTRPGTDALRDRHEPRLRFAPASAFVQDCVLIDRASRGLFRRLILISLLRRLILISLLQRQRILAQVAGHDPPVIELLPPLAVGEADLEWSLSGFAEVIGYSQNFGGMFDLGRTLVGQALRARAGAA
jgi:hypothetical protein